MAAGGPENLGWTAEQVERAEPLPGGDRLRGVEPLHHAGRRAPAFLGTAYVLEYLSVQRASRTVERLLARDAIPNIRKAVTFLRGHGGADGDHVAELAAVLRSLTDPEEQAALLLSARTTRALYTGLFPETEAPAT